ncbi:MAG: CBS domain-containing protein [Dehalococcoidia bacterium]
MAPGRPHALHSWVLAAGEGAPALPGTVASIMSHPLVTVDVRVSLDDALLAMRSLDIHHLLLLDRGRVVAVVSDRNLVRGKAAGPASRDEEHRRTRPVFQVAEYRLVTIHRDATIEEAASAMLVEGVSSLPVVDGKDEIVGIVTSRDLLRHVSGGPLRRAS